MSRRAESTGTPTASTPISGRSDQLLDQVDVVDHQVEDHVDVGAARLERRQAMGLDEQRRAQHVGERHERGVEALEMADLEDPAARRGERDQRVGLVEAWPRSASRPGHAGRARAGGWRPRSAPPSAPRRSRPRPGPPARRHRRAPGRRSAPPARARPLAARDRPRRPARPRRRATYFSAWKRPKWPQPTTAVRIGVIADRSADAARRH